MTTQTESYTRLHGRWLLIARLAWVATAILATIMHIAAAPVAFDLLRTPCYESPCDTQFQTPSEADSQASLEFGAWSQAIQEAAVRLLTLPCSSFGAGRTIGWRY